MGCRGNFRNYRYFRYRFSVERTPKVRQQKCGQAIDIEGRARTAMG
jgi:hypothetical protein